MLNIPTRANALLLLISITFAPLAHGFLRPAPVPEAAPDARGLPADEKGGPHIAHGENDSYDRRNPDFTTLQQADDALTGLPLDQNGKVDWARALRDGAISPRETLRGDDTYLPLDLDIIMRNTKAMPFVRFPHKTHTEWLSCSNCHPAIFAQKAGTAKIRMEDIFRGEFCGRCHDRVAFITHRACFRCHSVPQPNGIQIP
ncbi:MAG: hypothetical protein KDH20_11540 [Rhodocyclaceae bacterium]|nr:hypothetical protein [Rhodocyclaceae bacterium]